MGAIISSRPGVHERVAGPPRSATRTREHRINHGLALAAALGERPKRADAG
jgi:hypothetical protein